MGDLPEFVTLLMHQFLTRRAPPPGPYIHVDCYLRRDEPSCGLYASRPPALAAPVVFPPEPIVPVVPEFLSRRRCRNDHEAGPSHAPKLPSRKRLAISDPTERTVDCVYEVHEQGARVEEAPAAADRLVVAVVSESEDE